MSESILKAENEALKSKVKELRIDLFDALRSGKKVVTLVDSFKVNNGNMMLKLPKIIKNTRQKMADGDFDSISSTVERLMEKYGGELDEN